MTAVEHRQQLSKDIGQNGGEGNNNQLMKRHQRAMLESAENRQFGRQGISINNVAAELLLAAAAATAATLNGQCSLCQLPNLSMAGCCKHGFILCGAVFYGTLSTIILGSVHKFVP